MFTINGETWFLVPLNSSDDRLRRSDGSLTLGVTDDNTKCVYINRNLRGNLLDKVICHEITHCFCFSMDIFMDIETEELVADFLATYGRDVFRVADEVLMRFLRVV